MKTSNVLLLVFAAILVVVGVVVLVMDTGNAGLTGQYMNTQPAQNSTSTQNPANTQTPTMTVPTTQMSSSSSGNTSNVTIQSFAFSPQTLTINVGDTVIWTNMDSVAHSVVSNSGNQINSPNLSQGQSYSHTFTTAGTYTYHCSIHPNMMGTIIVVDPNSLTNTSGSTSSSGSGSSSSGSGY